MRNLERDGERSGVGLEKGPAEADLRSNSERPTLPSVDELYLVYAPLVHRRVLRFFEVADAEEVVHDVFVRIFERLAEYRGESSVATWLYRITTNHCLNALRDRSRRRELLATHGPTLQPLHCAPSQESVVFLGELWRQLPVELLAVGTYYYVDGLTHEEIARIQNVSRRTIGNRLAELELVVRRQSALPSSNGVLHDEG